MYDFGGNFGRSSLVFRIVPDISADLGGRFIVCSCLLSEDWWSGLYFRFRLVRFRKNKPDQSPVFSLLSVEDQFLHAFRFSTKCITHTLNGRLCNIFTFCDFRPPAPRSNASVDKHFSRKPPSDFCRNCLTGRGALLRGGGGGPVYFFGTWLNFPLFFDKFYENLLELLFDQGEQNCI